MKIFWEEMNTHQHVRSLQKPSELITTDLNEWSKTMPKLQNNYTNILERYQGFLKRKFNEVEDVYYSEVDELTQKLGDLDSKFEDVDFNLKNFSFIKEWEEGLVDSKYVYNIVRSWDAEEIAHTSMTRRMNNFMFKYEDTADYVKYTLAQVKEKALPLYIKYIEMLKKFFEKAADCDSKQEKITWITITAFKDNTTTNYAYDFTLNQTIRQLERHVIDYADQLFYMGNNAVCFNESPDTSGIIRSHWLFAPQNYINFLKSTYKIREALDLKDDAAYVKNMIAEHINVG